MIPDVADILDAQREIALQVLDQLGVPLLAAERAPTGPRPTHDIEAYNLYLNLLSA